MAILNYTTTIKPNKSILEISESLSKRGANKIIVDYKDGLPIGLTFQIIHKGQPIFFSLPSNIEGVYECLKRQNVPNKFRTMEQATRTSWRIIKSWIDAQMAIIDAELVTPAQVFLPYAITKSGKTIYEDISNISLLLPQADI